MKKLLIVTFLFLTACTPKRLDVPIFWDQTPGQQVIAAVLHARDIGGLFSPVAYTGSMEPFLTGGDYIVFKKIPYSEVKVGMMVLYQARWRPEPLSMVCHWVAAKSGDEFIMDGQANAHYEKGDDMRVGEKEFRYQVVAIYTQRKGPK